jgi:hypothetical protein
VPWRYLGRQLDARATDRRVELFWNGQLIKSHPVKAGGRQTDFADYPEEKIAFQMRTPVWCRTQAELIGPACAELIEELLANNALFRLRAAQGVIGLAAKHAPARLEQACRRALQVGDPAYRTVRGILLAGTETDPPPPNPGDGGAPALLHGQAVLFSDPDPASPSEVAS